MTQVENSVNLLERGMEVQDSRSSKKLWVIGGCIVFVLVFAFCICFFLPSKAPDNCWAQATLDIKTTATETNAWTWPNLSISCFKESSNQTLMIIKKGNYLLYVRMKRKLKDHVPFAIQLKKGNDVLRQKQSEEDTLDLLEIYHFNESDEISFTLNGNHFENIEKNPTQTYWGILHLPPHTPSI